MRLLKGIILGILLGIIGGMFISFLNYFVEKKEIAKEEESSIEDEVLRFHVRANSDSSDDQQLKLLVKEDVIEAVAPLIKDSESINQTKDIIFQNIDYITSIAENTLNENQSSYSVKVYLTKENFPTKQYGDLIFPYGEYEALRVDIGEAKGRNWWCVMYPPLCLVDESCAVVSEESKEYLQETVSQEEYYEIIQNQCYQDEADIKIQIKFKIVEEIKECLDCK